MSLTQFHRLRIADLRRETDDAVSIAFDVPATLRHSFAFTPGQYLTLRATIDGQPVRRAYSICAGADDGELRVAIKHVADGVFSHHANTRLAAGDTIEVMPPHGVFGTAPTQGGARLLLGLAAGSGITPILSILKTVLAREHDSRFILLYGSRSTSKVMFRTALDDLKDRFLDRMTVIHVLSREAQDIAALHGRLDGAKLRMLLRGLAVPAAIDQAFVCGPPGMADALCATLTEIGVPAAKVQVERFTPATPGSVRHAAIPRAPAAVFATATIIHDGKSNDIPVADGEAILDAALRAGLDLPWSCRGGMCSTCRARVTAGAITMTQNFSLEPWETDAGYALTCQARPTTPHVIVDYDQV